MRKKLNLKFYENIIDTDFFLIQKHVLYNKQKVDSKIGIWRQNFVSLNITKLQKELRQFIKVLDFILGAENKLVIFTKDSFQTHIFESYVKKYNFPSNILISERLTKTGDSSIRAENPLGKKIKKVASGKGGIGKKVVWSNPPQALLSFDPLTTENQKKLLVLNNFFLVANICFETRTLKDSSLYRVYNKMDTDKKFYFILAIMEKIINSRNGQKVKEFKKGKQNYI